jgi:heme/copper-type cytochrome/quinol oxidase subunit 2
MGAIGPQTYSAVCPSPVKASSPVLFWVVVGALGVLEALIVVAALRMRTTGGGQRGAVGSRPMEVLWTLLPALLLAAMVYLSFQTYQDDADAPSDDNAPSSASGSTSVDGDTAA